MTNSAPFWASNPARVLVVQRNLVLTSALRSALARDPDFTIVGEVSSAVEATRVAFSQRPDVVVCETTLPDPGPIELTRFFRLRLRDSAVVLLTASHSDEELFEAVRVGASAYLANTIAPSAFLNALRRASQGEFLIDEEVMQRPSVASRILTQFRAPFTTNGSDPVGGAVAAVQEAPAQHQRKDIAALFVPLSSREVDILDLIARGNSNKLIARRLGISDQTVKNHVTTILRKLAVNDRTEAVVYALRNGWIRIDSSPRVP